nr:nicotinate-nucleotide--dimethylbenzimidazole phosphoribosyltransferase [Herpetosiphon giganteus]
MLFCAAINLFLEQVVNIKDSWATIEPLDQAAIEQAQQRQNQLTKPQGALGQLEALSIQLAGIRQQCPPTIQKPIIIVAAADHGVAEYGVSAYPASVTAQMVGNFLAGGAAVSVLARHVGAELLIVDAGVQTAINSNAPNFRSEWLGAGTKNLAIEPAMSHEQAQSALARGIALAHELADAGHDLIALGEMGIGNTTAAACLTAIYCQQAAATVTGHGTGVQAAQYQRKIEVVSQAVARFGEHRGTLEPLAEVGGFEIGILAGIIVGAAQRRVPILLDGFITTAAALVAQAIIPLTIDYCIAAHCGAEPGHRIVLQQLGLRPLLQLDLRLGEGSGAALAIPLVQAACNILGEMATFASAQVDTAS